jgi:predicted transcriptional regulator
MKTATLTIRVEEEVKERIEKIARAASKSSSYLSGEAIKTFLDHNEWQIKAI